MERIIRILKSITRISLAVIVFYASYMYSTKLINFPYEKAPESAKTTFVEESNTEDTLTSELSKTVEDLTNSVQNKSEDEMTILPFPTKIQEKRIVLGKKNSIAFRDVVTNQSVSLLLYEIIQMDAKLKKGEPIYLVLDTPGGSVVAGNTLIDALNALGRPVHTISLFSASMGYHMVQSLGKRYITPSGTLMSHRVRIGGLSGQVPGEATVRLADIVRTAQMMDEKVADRIGMPVDEYQRMIWDEYWVNGTDAIRQGSSDAIAHVKCGMDMTGSYERTLMTFFGPLKLKWSECPLIRYPLEVNFGGLWIFQVDGNTNVKLSESLAIQRHNLRKFVDLYTSNREAFVREYILTNKYEEVLSTK